MTPLFDAHLDLAYNALCYDRDLTSSLAELRLRETPLSQTDGVDASAPTSQEHWGTITVSLGTMRAANIRVCLATLLARTSNAKALSAHRDALTSTLAVPPSLKPRLWGNWHTTIACKSKGISRLFVTVPILMRLGRVQRGHSDAF